MKWSRDVEELAREHATVMALLYLRGLSRPFEVSRRLWPHVLCELRRHSASVADTPKVLESAGFSGEATLASDPGLVERAFELVVSSRVVTPSLVDGRSPYPQRWLERLGPAAPPALWWNGVPYEIQDPVSVVGSRAPGPDVLKMVVRIGAWAASHGRTIVSGGAIGCDSASIRGVRRALERGFSALSGPSLEIVPFGLDQDVAQSAAEQGRAWLSATEPWASFTTPAAMERNALIYAASEWTLIGHARFRTGGTWIGATDALRRRLSRVAVYDWRSLEASASASPDLRNQKGSDGPCAHRALCALGAASFASLPDLEMLLVHGLHQVQGSQSLTESGGAQSELPYLVANRTSNLAEIVAPAGTNDCDTDLPKSRTQELRATYVA